MLGVSVETFFLLHNCSMYREYQGNKLALARIGLGLKTMVLQNLGRSRDGVRPSFGLEAGWKVSKAGAWRGLKERLSQDRPFPSLSKAIRRDDDSWTSPSTHTEPEPWSTTLLQVLQTLNGDGLRGCCKAEWGSEPRKKAPKFRHKETDSHSESTKTLHAPKKLPIF